MTQTINKVKTRRIIVEDDDLIDLFSGLQVSFPNSVEDISHFFSISKKNTNDKVNKIRETIIEHILSIPDSFINHPKYGSKWSSIKCEFCNVMDLQNVSGVDIKKRAGRQYNYDFLLSKTDSEIKIEFKFNCNSIFKLPQIIQISDNTLFRYSYAEFYYDEYLKKLCHDLDIDIIPTREEYIKLIYKTEVKVHPLFEQLKDCYKKSLEDKKKIKNASEESIRCYLEKYYRHLNLSKLSDYLLKAIDKTFLLWYKTKFIKQDIQDQFKRINIISIKNDNTIIVQSKYEYHLLLRWKNYIGILNPAWQISIKEITKQK